MIEENGSKVMVVFAIGERFKREYDRLYRPSHERYAEKIGAKLVVIDDWIQKTNKHPSWQKLLIFRHPIILKCDSVLIVDADIYIADHAENIFEEIGNASWAAAKNNAYDLPTYATTDMDLYEHCPIEGRPGFVLNCGMFFVSRTHASDMEKIFREQPEQTCYEQGPLSYYFMNSGNGKVLPSKFNTIVTAYVEAYGMALSSVLKMFDESSFLHFAAHKKRSLFYLVRWLDSRKPSFLEKLVRSAGRRGLDGITEWVLRIMNKIVGSYEYRLRR